MKFLPIIIIVLIIIIVKLKKRKKKKKKNIKNYSSNNQKINLYKNNNNILNGVEFLATLDFETCLVCGVLDRKKYNYNNAPALPLHDNCRCTLIPITEFSSYANEERPAQTAPFNYLAEQRYNALGKKRTWDSLADSTKQKYYYDEIKIYERSGRRAYTHVNKMNYIKWFNNLPQKYQKIKLGDERYKIFKDKNLTLNDLVDLNNYREYTIEELKNKYY